MILTHLALFSFLNSAGPVVAAGQLFWPPNLRATLNVFNPKAGHLE
jgi:hypothetical protein